jgi:hypothetical protein
MSSYHPKAGYFTELVRTWMELKEVCISPDVGARTRAAFNFDDTDFFIYRKFCKIFYNFTVNWAIYHFTVNWL